MTTNNQPDVEANYQKKIMENKENNFIFLKKEIIIFVMSFMHDCQPLAVKANS